MFLGEAKKLFFSFFPTQIGTKKAQLEACGKVGFQKFSGHLLSESCVNSVSDMTLENIGKNVSFEFCSEKYVCR